MVASAVIKLLWCKEHKMYVIKCPCPKAVT